MKGEIKYAQNGVLFSSEKDVVLTPATTGMDLENIMPSGRNQSQETA